MATESVKLKLTLAVRKSDHADARAYLRHIVELRTVNVSLTYEQDGFGQHI